MQTYHINKKKRKKALKNVVKNNIQNSKGFVKFCYGLTVFFRLLAVALGITTILYVILIREYLFYLGLLIMTFGFPFAFSFLPATVYTVSCGGEYRLRRRESIALSTEGFVYSFRDDRVGLVDMMFGFNVFFEKIDRFDYDEKTKCLTLYGTFMVDTYENNEVKESCEYKEFSLLDIYDIELKKILEKNVRK